MLNTTPIPITPKPVSGEKAKAVRMAVRQAVNSKTENDISRLATVDDVDTFLEFLKDPAVSAPIYTLPVELTRETIKRFIEKHIEEREKGIGLLFFNYDADGNFGGYTDMCIWPEFAMGELGGAVHPNRQGSRKGIEGARSGFDWMFETLGLDVICETASLENVRTARLLDGLGFRRAGQTLSKREDGTERASLVWEITKSEWNNPGV